jgi:hypothetical protein
MKTRILKVRSDRGAVATLLVLMVAGLMVSLLVAGASTVRRARRAVNATGEAQAKHWARVAEKGH